MGLHPSLSLSPGKRLKPRAGAVGQAGPPGPVLTDPCGEPPHPQRALSPASYGPPTQTENVMLVSLLLLVFGFFFYLYWESRVSRLSHLNCSLGNDSFWELFESEALHSDICGNPHRLASKQAWGKLRAPSFTLGEHFRQAACGIKHVQCL